MSAIPDKWQVLQSFWESFGIPAYSQERVPKDATMPYITYGAETGAIGDVLVLNASIWARDYSWEWISNKADEIAAFIGYGYRIQKTSGGYLWITRGTPFAQRMTDEDSAVRRIYINITAEFLTAY